MIFIGEVKKKRRFYKVDYWQDWTSGLVLTIKKKLLAMGLKLGTMDMRIKNKIIRLEMAILFILASSTAFALSDKEIINYAYEKYPILKEENIVFTPVTMIYVDWAGLYTLNKIQINKIHIFTYKMLDRVIIHELEHHKCWKGYKNTDVEHKICF